MNKLFRISGWLALPALLLLVAICWAGCQGLNLREINSPLTYQQQQEKILEIVPIGTPRDEAIEKLTAAGIAGDFAQGETVYYCGSWQRLDGSRWRTNVAVLFDESGNVYRTQPIEAGVGFSTPATLPAGDSQQQATSAAKPEGNQSEQQPVNSARSGLRRPFDD